MTFNNQKHPSNSTTPQLVSLFRNEAIQCTHLSSTCSTAQNLQVSPDHRPNKHKTSVLTNQNCTVAAAWAPYPAALCSCHKPWSKKTICSSIIPSSSRSSRDRLSRTGQQIAHLLPTANSSKVERLEETLAATCCWVEALLRTVTILRLLHIIPLALAAARSSMLIRAE